MPPPPPPDIPTPGGEMAARVRATDWSRTPLGPMERWPQSLLLAVNLCLNSRFPMYVWWGPDLIHIYNDAYAPMLGRRHPVALGMPARDVWREIWPALASQADAVIRRGESTWHEQAMWVLERHGYPEEAYFTWSQSPIPDDAGGVGGLFCVCTEETGRLRAEAQVSNILRSITDGFFALDRDWRFTYVNPACEQILGCTPGELIGKVLWEVYPGTVGGEFEHAYRKAAHERVTVSFTSYYPDHDRWYEVRAFPAEEGLSVYFRDETDRHRAAAEAARLAAMVHASRDGIFGVALDGRVETWNPGAERLFGYRPAEIIGKPVTVLTAADRQDDPRRLLDRLNRGERVPEAETVRLRKDGSPVDVSISLDPVFDAAGRVVAGAATVRDITGRKRAEARDRFLLALDDAVRPLTQPEEITAAYARGLGEHLRADRCAYADVEADEDTFNLTGDYNRGVPSIVGRYRFADFGAEVLRRMRADEPYVVADVDTHQPPPGDLSAYRQTMIRAVVCVPLHKAGRFVAAMAVHQAVPRTWTTEEVEIVRHVAGRCWESIERARVERDLRQSREQLALVVRGADVGVWYCPLPFDRLFWDEKVKEHFHLPPDAAVTIDTFYERLHPEDRARTRAAIEQSIARQEPYDIEYRTVSPDGSSVKWVRAIGRGFYGADGNPARFDGITFDITAQKRAEAELRDSERRFRDTADAAPAILWVTDPNGYCTYLSRSWYEFTGQREGEGHGLGWTNAVHPEDREAGGAAFLAASEARQAYSVDFRLRRADGAYRWVIDAGRPHFEGNGTFLGFVGSVIDVDDRRRALDQLRDDARVIETINFVGRTVAAELDLGKLVQAVTDATTKLTGAEFGAFFYNVTDEQGRAMSLYSLSGVPRALFEQFPMPRDTDVFGPTLRGEGVIRLADVTADPRYGRHAPYHGLPAGHLPVRSYLAVPVISRTGEVLGGLFFGHADAGVFTERAERVVAGIAAQAAVAIDNARLFDAARRANAEKDRLLASERAARAEAERSGRMKDEFLATLSHELRTPLNAILGWSQILSHSAARNEEDLAEGLRTIERNARAQTQIIEDLLDMSRIISGKVRLDVQRVDLAPILQGAVETARPAAAAKGVRLGAVLDPSAGPVSGDPNRLQQVFWNLMSNAVKFTPRGGRVQVLLERVNSHLEVSVIDTGEGIKPEFLPHVFDRFRQADASTTRRHGGLGLGLAIAKQLVELHGGTIRVKSAGDGQGSTFTVALPLTVLHLEPEASADAERRHPQAAAGPGAVELSDLCDVLDGVRVLVVDDEPDARALVRRLLEDCNAVVTVAGSAQEAFDRLQAHRPDVLVSDIGMPGEDGYSLIRRVRALGPGHGGDVPAVALTAYARSEDRTRSILAGYQMHVAKPVEPAELVAMVASLAGRAGGPGAR